MFADMNTELKSLTVLEMVKHLYPRETQGGDICGEPRLMYDALQEVVNKGQELSPKQVFSKLKSADITYHSVQKKLQRLSRYIDNILEPYFEKFVGNPQLSVYLRSELIRFGAYFSDVMCLDDTSGQGQNTATLRAKNHSLEQEIAVLQDQNLALLSKLNKEISEKESELDQVKRQQQAVLMQLEHAIKDKQAIFELAHSQQTSLSRQLEDTMSEKAQTFQLLQSQQSQLSRQLEDAMNDKEHAHTLAKAQQEEITTLIAAQSSVFDSKQGEALFGEVFRIQESLNHQQHVMFNIVERSRQQDLVSEDSLLSLRSDISEVLSKQKAMPDLSSDVVRLFGALGELKSEIVTLSSDQSSKQALESLKSDITAVLATQKAIPDVSPDVLKLHDVLDELKSEVLNLSRLQSNDPTLQHLVKSNVSIMDQLEDVSLQVKAHLDLNLNADINKSISASHGALTLLDEKVSKLSTSQLTTTDMQGMNRTFEYLGQMLKEVIAINQEFEERTVVPVESISHLVKTNESLHNKNEKIADEKRDAVKQLSNMIKATSSASFQKTNGIDNASILELKSKISKLEGELMKSKEDRSTLRRQVQAKQKKLDGFYANSAVSA